VDNVCRYRLHRGERSHSSVFPAGYGIVWSNSLWMAWALQPGAGQVVVRARTRWLSLRLGRYRSSWWRWSHSPLAIRAGVIPSWRSSAASCARWLSSGPARAVPSRGFTRAHGCCPRAHPVGDGFAVLADQGYAPPGAGMAGCGGDEVAGAVGVD
jgi:hypothetical protein